MRLVLLLSLLVSVWVTGCKEPAKPVVTTIRVPKEPIKIPEFKLDLNFLVCDADKQNISQTARDSAQTIKGTTDRQDLEVQACESKKLIPKAALRTFKTNITFQPPIDLKGEVVYATLSNARTCWDHRIFVKKSVALDDAAWEVTPYNLSSDGILTVGLIYKVVRAIPFLGVNVRAGENLMEITYFGNCPQDTDGEAAKNCSELARKSVLINVELEVRELNGIKVVNTCGRNG